MSWLLIWFGENVYHLYVARLLGGFFGGSGYMIIPIFLSEIADDNVRGKLMSTLILTETTGILLGYIIGSSFDFYAIPKFAIALTTIFSISLYFLPETSLFLMKQNRVNVSTWCLRIENNLVWNCQCISTNWILAGSNKFSSFLQKYGWNRWRPEKTGPGNE